MLSMAMFLLRFVLIAAGAVGGVWYGLAGHHWTGTRYYVTLFAVGLPVLFIWSILERKVWNYDLRRNGLASEGDIWGVTQFPEE